MLSQVLISLNSSSSQLDFKLHADVDTDEEFVISPSSAEDSERPEIPLAWATVAIQDLDILVASDVTHRSIVKSCLFLVVRCLPLSHNGLYNVSIAAGPWKSLATYRQ